jgi:A nuclease family of the HNH/ENDO VII superfamily with conserved AHH
VSDIGESVFVPDLSAGKDDCWYCKKPKEKDVENDLAEDPTSLGRAENDLKNDSSKLGTALGFRPTWSITVPDVDQPVDVTPAAHHLIPGNASLKEVPNLLKYMKKGQVVRGDIGYDVNSRENGVWLPGSYAVTARSVHDTKWSDYAHQDSYALAAMKRAGGQFHDAHPRYSLKVKSALNQIADRIKVRHPEKCPGCDETLSDKARPPYGLVGRLNALSRVQRRFLSGPPRKWPVETGYYTSDRALRLKSLV